MRARYTEQTTLNGFSKCKMQIRIKFLSLQKSFLQKFAFSIMLMRKRMRIRILFSSHLFFSHDTFRLHSTVGIFIFIIFYFYSNKYYIN